MSATKKYVLLLLFVLALKSGAAVQAANPGGDARTADHFMMTDDMPGSEFQLDRRLVAAGESIRFSLREFTPEDRFEIFPRYLERCDPERARQSREPLQWLDDLDRETLAIANAIQYSPREAGNYLARWTSQRHGVEYRYFAAVDQSYVIYRPAVWCWPTPFPATGGPEIHNGGLPLDWCLDATTAGTSYHARLRDEQQRYGGGLVYGVNIPRQAAASAEAISALVTRVTDLRSSGLDVGRVGNLWYGGGLSNAKVQVARSAGFDVIDGYVPRASTCGLGAPYFPFYISPSDYRWPNQDGPTGTTAFVFDFVGSWHFHGPIGFHRPSAQGSWPLAKFHIDLAAQEAVLTARNSGTHNVITTLVNFESPVAWANADRGPGYNVIWDAERGQDCFERYMHLLAFEHPRRWPIVFARAADYADYFRAHCAEMPRRIVSSITHDVAYDRFWTDEWHEQGLTPSGYVPFAQSLRDFRETRVMPPVQYAHVAGVHQLLRQSSNLPVRVCVPEASSLLRFDRQCTLARSAAGGGPARSGDHGFDVDAWRLLRNDVGSSGNCRVSGLLAGYLEHSARMSSMSR